MKKFALLIALNMGLASFAYAKMAPSYCSILLVDIVNQTTSKCILLQKYVNSGTLRNEKTLEEIPAGKKTNGFVSLSSDFDADLTLSYMCGEGMATFNIHKDACVYGGKSSATLTSIAGMHANYAVSQGIYHHIVDFRRGNLTFFDLPGGVKWIFSAS